SAARDEIRFASAAGHGKSCATASDRPSAPNSVSGLFRRHHRPLSKACAVKDAINRRVRSAITDRAHQTAPPNANGVPTSSGAIKAPTVRSVPASRRRRTLITEFPSNVFAIQIDQPRVLPRPKARAGTGRDRWQPTHDSHTAPTGASRLRYGVSKLEF